MQNFPRWKQILILGICALGILIALPNAFYGRVERANDARAAMAAGEAATPELLADASGWLARLADTKVGQEPPQPTEEGTVGHCLIDEVDNAAASIRRVASRIFKDINRIERRL